MVHQFDELLKSEIEKYNQKLISEVKNGKRGSIYPFLRRIAHGPNDMKNKSFHIQTHLDNNFSPLQCAEDIATYFSSISQEYHPLDISRLSPNLQTFLTSQSVGLPVITDYNVFMKMSKSKV